MRFNVQILKLPGVVAKILRTNCNKCRPMNAKDKIYEQRTFDDEPLSCPHCGWRGTGLEAHIAGFYGLSKFKEVLVPPVQ
jgi:hypothetical protein